jgi:hypothetical protein
MVCKVERRNRLGWFSREMTTQGVRQQGAERNAARRRDPLGIQD